MVSKIDLKKSIKALMNNLIKVYRLISKVYYNWFCNNLTMLRSKKYNLAALTITF